jgi:deoxycytidine triphosphate deaminase
MNKDAVKYSFDSENNFIIENYNWARPFSGFFPGIAGKWGIPLWIYYVSHGQAVCSLGSKDKDGAILEFLSFNRACQMVGLQGFRTFLRLNNGPVHEPFRKVQDVRIQQKLILQSHELILEEKNELLNLEIRVTYFPLVQSPIAGLIRHLSITNNGEQGVDIQLVDGVPRLIPYGATFENVKVISSHIEGMMGVDELDGLPLFRLKQTSEDLSEIGRLKAANFYASFQNDGNPIRGTYLIDPEILFGTPYDFSKAWSFQDKSVEELIGEEQLRENRTPCAFTPTRDTIQSGGSFSLYSILGFTSSEDRLGKFMEQMGDSAFFTRKRIENKELIEEIKNQAFTVSSQPLFDQYCQETFLENVMRGGMPTFFGQEEDDSPFYIYSRQNGDLERDYHWFILEPTYLSQGNGHYRSICQNRRMDTWFFPKVKAHNIKLFMNLIQLDGYNPLVINGQRYVGVDKEHIKDYLLSSLSAGQFIDELTQFVMQPFTPGEFIHRLEDHQVDMRTSYDTLLGGLLKRCRKTEVGELHAGFWIDHWLYNLDLIDHFLAIHPDRLKEVLWDDRSYTFYDNPDVVVPRREKYVLRDGKVRQYHAVRRDLEKHSIIDARSSGKNKVRTLKGYGEIYHTNLFVKLLCIFVNKIAALDSAGLGVEMEADKPGWLDSLNGLPGLMGSSLCQTLELLRASRFMVDSMYQMNLEGEDILFVFTELARFVRSLATLLEGKNKGNALAFWEQSHQVLESYRAETRLGIDGSEDEMKASEISHFLEVGLNHLEEIFSLSNRDKLEKKEGIPYTYFVNEVTEYERKQSTESSSPTSLRPIHVTQRPLSLFLEGPVHYLKLFPQESKRVYEAVHSSTLFDASLKMYKVCESLLGESYEIGRIRAYASGWIENGSIYTHMEYKWLLELLRSGLVDRFYEELKHVLPPYMEPKVYGRSTLENCSFIVSSAFPDPGLHGKAFQPRLSGVTAEWLEIWTLIVAGIHPFRLDSSGALQLALEPLLPDWLFTEKVDSYRYWDRGTGWEEVAIPSNSFAFRFLGQTLVIYHNPERKSTFGSKAAAISSCAFTYRNGESLKESGPSFSDRHARSVREGKVRRMDVILE